MKKILSALAAVVLLLASAIPAAAGCDPGRASAVGSWRVYRTHAAQSGVTFLEVEATIEEDAPYTESGGSVWQYLELKKVQTGVDPSIRLGVSRTAGDTRIYIYATESTGNVGPLYYSFPESLSQAPVRIARSGGASNTYYLWSGSTRLTTIYFDAGWSANTASQWVVSNNNGNQFPGTSANAAYFLNAKYTSQYGVGGLAGMLTYSISMPAGVQFGTNATGFWTRDNNC